MEGQADRNSNNTAPGDWVKELFVPIYNFEDIVAEGKNAHENKSIIKSVPILDPISVKEVFDRVHQRVVEAETKTLNENKERKEEKEHKSIDPRKSSIWNTEELDTLRKVYKASKDEIRKLEVTLKDSKAHSNSLETKLSQERKRTESLTQKLAEVTKSNQRLVIHRDSLQKDLAVLEVKLAALTNMWHEIEGEKTKSLNEAKEARIQLDKERLHCQRLESSVMEANKNLLRETALIQSNLQTKYETEIKDLQEVIRDLTVELRDERQRHLATKRGLDHLRQHFSSIPLQDILPSSVVEKDQVSIIDHLT